ncbi:MAG: hypothetical protein FJ308_09515 [Planctomycetes bacterium]|nr:hypothetical protein [Planctomycetota bacterium]
MKKYVSSMCMIGLLTAIVTGCAGEDPAKKPGFDEKAFSDPTNVKMGADAPATTANPSPNP